MARAAGRETLGRLETSRDLNGVLDALGIIRPVVLVGHSAGGLYARAFTGLYEGQVAGIVLVDSSHEAAEQMVIPELAWYIRAVTRLVLPVTMMLPRRPAAGRTGAR